MSLSGSDQNFQDNFNNTAKTVQTTIAVGYIVLIVLVAVGIISAIVVGIFLYRRHRRRQRERNIRPLNIEQTSNNNWPTYHNQLTKASTPQPSYSEMNDSTIPARWEVPNTEMTRGEMPTHEMQMASSRPDGPRHELNAS